MHRGEEPRQAETGQPVWTWLSGFRLARFFTAVH